MNRPVLIAIILLGVVLFIRHRNKQARINMIDWLNVNVSNAGGNWVNMDTEEIKKVYKVYRSIKESVKPSNADFLEMKNILDKYKISIQ